LISFVERLMVFFFFSISQIEIIALSPTLSSIDPPPSFAATSIDKFIDRTWLSLDALPFIASFESAKFKFSLASQAVAAVEEAVSCLEVLDSSTMRIEFDQKRQVFGESSLSCIGYSGYSWKRSDGLQSMPTAVSTSTRSHSSSRQLLPRSSRPSNCSPQP